MTEEPSMKPERFSSGNARSHGLSVRRASPFNEAGAFQLRKQYMTIADAINAAVPSMKPERFSSGNINIKLIRNRRRYILQ